MNMKAGSDLTVSTTREFAAIKSYLEGKKYSAKDVLWKFKDAFTPKMDSKGNYYYVDAEEMWKYIQRQYGEMLMKKRIDSYEELISKAVNYCDEYMINLD